jgi:hypothetical protein
MTAREPILSAVTRPRKPSSTRAADRSTHPRASSAWFITLAATAASTYALDAVATAAGVLLVASQLLTDLDHLLVLAFLAATYLLWGVNPEIAAAIAVAHFGGRRTLRVLQR